jgi:hypothetical protein
VEVEEKGQKVKKSLPHVITGEGATAKAEPLDVLMQRDHDLLMPALTTATTATTTTRTPARDPLPPAPRETGTSGAPSPDAVQSVRRRAVGAF